MYLIRQRGARLLLQQRVWESACAVTGGANELLWQTTSTAYSSIPSQFRFLKIVKKSPEAPKPKQTAPVVKRLRTNDNIKAPSLRVVFPDGSNRLLDLPEALAVAREQGLDLVEIAPTANPPVAKLIKYSEYLKETRKAEEELAKRSRQLAKAAEAKEMHFTTKIADHDLETKLKKTRDMLASGRRVSLILEFKNDTEKPAATAALAYIVTRLEDAAQAVGKMAERGRSIAQLVAPLPPPQQSHSTPDTTQASQT